MAQIKRGGAHGLFRIAIQKVDDYGISLGTTGASLAEGAVSNAYDVDDPTDCGLTIPEGTVVDFTGGDAWITSFMYGISSLGGFTFQTRSNHADLIALTSNTNVDQTTNDKWTMYTENTLQREFSEFSLIITYRVQSFETATFGATKFISIIVPRATIKPMGNQGISYQTVSSYQFQVTPRSTGREINGTLFGANLNATDNIVSHYVIITDKPLWMAVGKASGTSLDVVGTYKPYVADVGTSSSTNNRLTTIDGSTYVATPSVAGTITQSSATFAVASGLTAGDIVTVLYETNFEEAS